MRATDPSYGLINWAAAQFGLGIWAVNLACAAIFGIGLISLCRGQPNPPLTMAIAVPYLVIVITGYTRESVALGLVMLATSQFGRGAYFKMALWLLLAISFHHSAIITVPIFGLAASRERGLNAVLFVLLGVVGYYQFSQSHFDTLYKDYIEAAYSSSGATIRILMDVVPAAIFLSIRRRFGFPPQVERLWTLFAVAAFVALVVLFLSPSSTAVDRTALYLVPMQAVVLGRVPKVLGAARRENLLLVLVVLSYSLAVELVWLNFGVYSRCWVPYQNYVWKQSPYERETMYNSRR